MSFDFDPDEPFETPPRRPRRPGNARLLWQGIGSIAGAVALAAFQVYLYVTAGLIWTLAVGGAIGLLLIGGMSLFYYFDDRR